MKFTFANGTAKQKALWEEAVHHLLHLPVTAMPLSIAVSFVEPSELIGHGHTDLALTTYTYGSESAKMQVRNDAPSFGDQLGALKSYAASLGLTFSIERFYLETSIHELGHALFAALPEAQRIAIAQMFGAQSDDIEEINPSGKPWQDRISEAIAETFKDAFLPRRFRVFPNRTNIHLPFHRYPEFRALWRQSAEQIVGEPLEPGEVEVEGYDLDIFKQGGYRKTERFEDPFAPELGEVGEYLEGDGGFWDTLFREAYVGLPWELVGSSIQSEFQWEAWVKDGTTLSWSLPLSLAPFEQNGTAVTLHIYRPIPSVRTFFEGRWIRADEAPDGFTREGDATSFLPPATVTDSMLVNSINFGTTIIKCHKTSYRRVRLNGLIKIDLFPHTLSEHEALREALLYSWLAPFPFVQAACTDESEPAEPIVLPVSSLEPGPAKSGRHGRSRPTTGSRLLHS